MAVKFANLASTTLASSLSNTATSISVTSSSSFPTLGSGDYFYASIGEGSGSEIVKVTGVSSNTFTVVRGQDGTSAQNWSSGSVIALRVVAAALDDIAEQAQTAADTESVSIDGDTMTGALTVDTTSATSIIADRSDAGSVIEVKTNGSSVGTIGANAARLYIHNNYGIGAGFRFDNGSIRPAASDGANEDATTDLGIASVRWRNLFLSGSLTAGGEIISSDAGINIQTTYNGTVYTAGTASVDYFTGNTSLRAPIFYDSANTSYFLDPAATGNSLKVAGTILAEGAGSSLKGPVYIAAQNTTGEGGEITLNGSNGNTSHTLDTVNGTFRIFESNGTFLNGNYNYGLNTTQYRVGSTVVIDSSRRFGANVAPNASYAINALQNGSLTHGAYFQANGGSSIGLEINANASTYSGTALYVRQSTVSTGGNLARFANSSGDKFIVTTAGNVGINVANPSSALDIRGAGSGGSQKNTIAFGNSGWGGPLAPNAALDGGVKLALFEGSTQKVQIGMDGNARLWLMSAGSGAQGVDIYTGSSNTAAPSLRLRVDQSGTTNIYGALSATGNLTGAALIIDGNTAVDKSGNYMVFYDGSGAPALYAGNTADNRNYYQSDNHRFRSNDAGTNFAEIGSLGMIIGDNGPEANMGKLHVKDSDSGATPYQSGNGGITIERNGRAALNFLTPSNQDAYVFFGDPQSANAGYVGYEHANDVLVLKSAGYVKTSGSGLNISAGYLQMGGTGVIDGSRNVTAGTGTFEGGGNTLLLKKGTGTPAIAFAGTASDPQTTALIEGISGGGLKIYTSSGTISSPSWSPKFTLAANGNVSIANDLTVSGNFSVLGTTTTLNTATLQVEDKNITLNYGTGDTSGSANGAGITIQDAVSSSTDATILWDATDDEFDFSHPITVASRGDVVYENSGTKSSGDFNNFTTGGNYVISNHANISNSPPNSYAHGLLRVTQISGTSILSQEYIPHASGEGTFIRLYWSPHGWTSWRESVTFSSDGSGSGLDADLLDGHDSGSFLRSNVTDNYTSGTLSFNSNTALKMLNGSAFNTSDGDVYASMRVIRNAGTSNLDGMYIGYANANSGVTRLFGEGGTSNGVYVYSDHTRVNGSTRSPLYYDLDNTAYYANPAGNSILSSASIGHTSAPSGGYSLRVGSIQSANGSIDYLSQVHFNDNLRFYDEGNNSYLNFKWGSSGSGGIKFRDGDGNVEGYIYGDTGGFGILSSDGTWAVSSYNARTYIYHELQTPIVYDMDNTAYYLNPASNSNLVTLTLNNGGGNGSGAGLTVNGSGDIDLTSGGSVFFGSYNYSASTYIRGYESASGFRFYVAGTERSVIESNQLTHTSSIRSPIFYDSNDTAFYVNPNSGGFVLQGGTNNRVTFTTVDSGLRVQNPEGNGEGDLRLGAAWGRTGIYSQGVMNVMSDNTGGIAFIIDNTEYGRLNTDYFTHTSDIRAPLFYDSNNTGFYIDPSQTSNFNHLNVSTFKVDNHQVLDLTNNSTARGPWNPIASSIRSSGYPVYNDEDFQQGLNGVGVYNNSGGNAVTISRVTASSESLGGVPNSSNYVVKIAYLSSNTNGSSPGFGGFHHNIPSEENHTFVQVFQAKLPSGRSLNIAENPQGNNNTSYWLTNNVGTGKWEWYVRVSHCGTGGTFSSGGHVYVTGGTNANFTWYLASINVYDVTEANHKRAYQYTANSRMDSPIYYDSGNTAYYVNPDSTSRINVLETTGGTSTFNSGRIALRADGIEDHTTNADTGFIQVNYYGYQNGFSRFRNFDVYNGKGANLLSVQGAGGYTQINGSTRSPIFYDSNDTAYYTNPNGTSILSKLSVGTSSLASGYNMQLGGPINMVNNAIHYAAEIHFNANSRFTGVSNETLDFKAAHSSNAYLRFRDGGGNIKGGVYGSGTSIGFLDSDSQWAIKHDRDSRTGFYINNVEKGFLVNDQLTHVSSVRAPIFYDVDNTGYYVNPASTSEFNRINQATVSINEGDGQGIGFWNDVGGGAYSIWMSATSNSTYGGRVTGETTSDYNMYFGMDHGTNRGFVFRNGSTIHSGIDASGNARFNGSVVAGTAGTQSTFQARYNASDSYHGALGWNYLQLGNNGANRINAGRTSTGGHLDIHTNVTGTNTGGTHAARFDTGGNVYSYGSSRAPIFYDSNNTGYYAHLDGSSNLNNISANTTTLGKIKFKGEGTNSNQTNDRYAIYQEAGSWSHPFPDLIIGYHTGIKIGGYTGYGGTRFYNDNPSNGTEIFSVGDGDNNIRATNDLILSQTSGSRRLLMGNQDSAGVNAPAIMMAANAIFYWGKGNTWSGNGGTFTEYGQVNADYLSHTSDIRAPLFYDTNDTAYFLDPNTSGDSLKVAGNVKLGRHIDALNVWDGTGNNRKALFLGWYGGKVILGNNVDSGHDTAYNYNDDAVISVNPFYSYMDVISRTAVRAPIFYDTDNTNYYVNPASTSKLSVLAVSNIYDAATSGGRATIYMDGNFHLDAKGSYDIFANYYSGRRFRTFYGSQAESFRTDTDGIVYAYNQFRTPLIYDYNNTGFYLDPASTSAFSTIKADDVAPKNAIMEFTGVANGSFSFTNPSGGSAHYTARGGRVLTSNSSGWHQDGEDPTIAIVDSHTGTDIDSAGIGLIMHNEANTTNAYSPGMMWTARSSSSNYDSMYAAVYGRKTGTGPDTNWNAGELHFFTTPASAYVTSTPDLRLWNHGDAEFKTSVRAPTFYDKDNAAYYTNPAGNSNQVTITLNNGGGNGSGAGLTINGSGDIDLMSGGSVFFGSYNYSNSTYIRGYESASGFRFHVAGTMRSVIESAQLTHDSSIRSPIFYDVNNTGYYSDNASTSRFNVIHSNDYKTEAGDGRGIGFWNGAGGSAYSIFMSSATNGTYGGRVGGETTSDYNMYFRMGGGTNRGWVFTNGAANPVAGIDASGNIRAEGNVVAYSASDRKLKDNIKPIENALDKVCALNGYTFNWNDQQTIHEAGKADVGVIAQEVIEQFPEVCKERTTAEGDTHLGVDYERLVPALIGAIRELKDEIESLKEKIK